MTNIVIAQKTSDLQLRTMDALFAEAKTLGRLSLFQTDDGRWCATIDIPTIAGVAVEAKGGFRESEYETMETAIANAHKIREQFK